MENLGPCLKAISDETRLSIIQLLLRFNFCVGALAKRLDVSEAAVSQHLKILRECGLISSKKTGYFNYYEVNRERLNEISVMFTEMSGTERLPCDPSLERCEVKKRCICHADKCCKGCDCFHDCRKCHKTKEAMNDPSKAHS